MLSAFACVQWCASLSMITTRSHARTHALALTRAHASTHAHNTRTHTHARAPHTHKRARHPHTHTHTHTHTHPHTHTHTHPHTHTHTHTRLLEAGWRQLEELGVRDGEKVIVSVVCCRTDWFVNSSSRNSHVHHSDDLVFHSVFHSGDISVCCGIMNVACS